MCGMSGTCGKNLRGTRPT
jgi:hypothetical protein